MIVLLVLLLSSHQASADSRSPFSDSKFFLGSEMANFDQAKVYCGSRGAILAKFVSRQEEDWAWSQFGHVRKNGSYWIGTRNNVNSTWFLKWIDGTEIAYQAQLNRTRYSTDCVAIYIRDQQWVDLACHFEMYPLCKMAATDWLNTGLDFTQWTAIFCVTICLIVLAVTIWAICVLNQVKRKVRTSRIVTQNISRIPSSGLAQAYE
ncbi:hypothetical protein HDE_09107 [Halotydeus destructor]|nr:hypothetical protein HDE_09107 [Halotydeus destructor]